MPRVARRDKNDSKTLQRVKALLEPLASLKHDKLSGAVTQRQDLRVLLVFLCLLSRFCFLPAKLVSTTVTALSHLRLDKKTTLINALSLSATN